MSYQKQNFRDGEVLSAEQLNRMEEGIAKLETNMITAEEPADSADVQSSVESILKSIEDKGNNILAQIQQNGGKGLNVYCWGDSLTQGIGGNVNGWHLISYPQVLAERCNAVNLGILSDNVPTIMARMGADAILLPACTIPASSSESVVVGNTTNGMSLESGRTAHLLKYGDCGINPCYVNDVPCVLFRDYASDTTDGQNIRIRRLEDGDALTVAADTKLTTYGAKHYKGNGLHIFWMGANGGYGSDAEGKNLDFSDYVAQLQKCVDYVAPADYLIIYARERKDYATDEAAEVQELKETFKGHLIDLLPQLNDRGLLYGETNVWDGTLVKGVPKTLDSGDGCHYSFYGYMAIGKIVWEYVAPRLLNASEESGGTDTPPTVESDSIGELAYRLKAPKVLTNGSKAINTGFKPFAEGADAWTIAVKYADGLTATDASQWGTLMFCEVTSSKTQLKVATLNSSKQFPECNVMCNSGGFGIDVSKMGLTVYDGGYHTFIVTKNGDDYTFYLDNNKIYMNSYSPCMDDFNYYDTELHTLNTEGASATGVDQMVLDVNFNTKEQTILEKSFSAYVYTNEKLGSVNAEADGATGKAVLELTNLKENTDYAWYAVVTNTASDIEKSGVYEFTTAKKNERVNTGGSDSDNQENTNSDKLIGSIETGDRAKIWLFVLLGLSAAGIGAVTVIKKKEA